MGAAAMRDAGRLLATTGSLALPRVERKTAPDRSGQKMCGAATAHGIAKPVAVSPSEGSRPAGTGPRVTGPAVRETMRGWPLSFRIASTASPRVASAAGARSGSSIGPRSTRQGRAAEASAGAGGGAVGGGLEGAGGRGGGLPVWDQAGGGLDVAGGVGGIGRSRGSLRQATSNQVIDATRHPRTPSSYRATHGGESAAPKLES